MEFPLTPFVMVVVFPEHSKRRTASKEENWCKFISAHNVQWQPETTASKQTKTKREIGSVTNNRYLKINENNNTDRGPSANRMEETGTDTLPPTLASHSVIVRRKFPLRTALTAPYASPPALVTRLHACFGRWHAAGQIQNHRIMNTIEGKGGLVVQRVHQLGETWRVKKWTMR